MARVPQPALLRAPRPRTAIGPEPTAAVPEPVAASRADPDPPVDGRGGWRATARAVLPAFLLSRLVAWLAGVVAVWGWGVEPVTRQMDPLSRTSGLGSLGDVLVAPFARWDSVWLLDVADRGYPSTNLARTAFFPLYPLLVHVGGWITSPVVAGIAISFACAYAGTMVVHRLATLELGPRAATGAVWALCLFPGSLWLTAVYTEGLFLLLSAACLLAVRDRRWVVALLLGILATATRSAGVVLVVPVLVVAGRDWWAIRRAGLDQAAAERERAADDDDTDPGGRASTHPTTGDDARRAGRSLAARAAWAVREPVLVAVAIPLGLVVFAVGLAMAGHPITAPIDVQAMWGRETVGPVAGTIDGTRTGIEGLQVLLGSSSAPVGVTPLVAAIDLGMLLSLVVAVVALVGAARRLPAMYAAYAGVALLLPLSSPALGQDQPLMSVLRFAGVLFPLAMWTGWWAMRGPAWRRWALAVPGLVLLGAVSALTARWIFVA